MTDERRVPGGRLGRLGQLARLGARTGASLLLSSTGDAAAKRAAEVLGEMRGLAAKVGQLASYVDGLVPPEHREAYERSLRSLQASAPRSPWADIRATIEEDLRQPVASLFAELEPEPFASASIGQVHRGRLHSGEAVAVKVQHAGIAKAIEADLSNASLLERFVGATIGSHFESKRVLEELKERFREELDYPLEAERQKAFAELHEGDGAIRIPRVFGSHVGKRVLTTELVSGARLDEVASLPEAERRSYGEVLWRFVYKSNLVGGMFNADPHPGNYLFQPSGRVAFLDFGCIQPIPPERKRLARAMHAAARRGDEAAFRRWAAALIGTKGGRWEEIAVGYARRSFEPLFSSPFRITPSFVADTVAEVRSRQGEVLRLGKGDFAAPPPGMVLMNRLQFGFYSVLARLDVAVDYAAVERAFLSGDDAEADAAPQEAP